MSDLDGDYVLHVLRNAWGHDSDEVRKVRLAAADTIERLAKARHEWFENWQAVSANLHAANARCDALLAALERIGDATHDFKRSAYDVIAIIRGIAKDAVGRGTERAAIQPTVAHPECICPTCGIRHGGGGRAGDF